MPSEPQELPEGFVPLDVPLNEQALYMLGNIPAQTVAREPDWKNDGHAYISLTFVPPYQSNRKQPLVNFWSDQEAGKVLGISRAAGATDSDILSVLVTFPDELRGLRDEIQHKLSLPKLTRAHAMAADQRVQAQSQRDEHIKKVVARVMQLPKPIYSELSPEKPTTYSFGQAGGAVIFHDSTAKHLITPSVAICVAVQMKTKDGVALLHMDAATDVKTMQNAIDALRPDDSTPVEVQLWGGRPVSYASTKSAPLVADIADFLDTQPNVKITAADVLNPERKHNTIITDSSGNLMTSNDEPYRFFTWMKGNHPPLAIEPCEDLKPLNLSYVGERTQAVESDHQSLTQQGALEPEGFKAKKHEKRKLD